MNIFEYAARAERAWEMQMQELSGYERKTTFYSDLSIADCFGIDAVKDTYRRVLKEWIHDIEYITEFALCLNHKSWEHASYKGDAHKQLSELYAELWYEISDKIHEHYKDNEEALDYFFQVTD